MSKVTPQSGSLNLYPLLTKRARYLRHYNIYRLIFSFAFLLSLLAASILAYSSPLSALPLLTQLYFAPVFLFAYLAAKTLTHYYHLQGFLQSPLTVRTYRYNCTLSTGALFLTLGLCVLSYILAIPAILPFIPPQFSSFLQATQLASFTASLLFTLATFLHLNFANFSLPVRSDMPVFNLLAKNPDTINALEQKGLFKNYLAPFKPILPSDATKLSNLVNHGTLSSYPLEIAVGFMDLAIFKECYHNQKNRNPNFADSCQRVHMLINAVVKSLKAPSSPILSNSLDTLIQIQEYIIAQKPNTIYTPDCTTYVYSQKELCHFPNLARTLAHIPLPTNTQYPHLNKYKLQRRHQQLMASLLPQVSANSSHPLSNNRAAGRLLSQAFNYFNITFSNMSEDSLTPSFSILKKRMGLLRLAADKEFSSSPIPQQRLVLLAHLFIKMGKYSTLFQDPLSASISLNHPGRTLSLQITKPSSNNSSVFTFVMHLGITLVARSLTCIQITEQFLDSLRTQLTDRSFHKVYADLRDLCMELETNIFKHISQMSTGSTLPRFLLLHGGRKNRPRDIVQRNKNFSAFFTTDGKFSASSKCSGIIQESDIASLAAQNLPQPNLFLDKVYQRHSYNDLLITDNIKHVVSIWSQLETPRLPFWYHCTKFEEAKSILNSGQVNVSHKIFSGAFLSTQIESGYGEITLAFSQETPLMSDIYNTTGFSDSYIWHGCSEPIKLTPHLVAIGYPSNKLPRFLDMMEKIGVVSFSSEGNPLYLQNKNHRVFLFTNSELHHLRSLLLETTIPTSQATTNNKGTTAENSTRPNMFATPRYLSANLQKPHADKDTPRKSLDPLKSQIENCNKTLQAF